MKEFTSLLALPASLITLLSSLPPAYSESWPFNLPPHERYFPEHEPHIKRDIEVQQRLATASPAGMRKMSGDEGEKFFMEYWQFEDSNLDMPRQGDERADGLGPIRAYTPAVVLSNGTAICGLLPPVLPHSDKPPFEYLPRIFGRSLFERDFQCPAGTSNCASIGQPDTCCTTGETCISVQDTGSGPVGCCPSGESCGGEVAACNTAAGYTSCPGSSNGGCCIPGYSCQGVGCIYLGSTTTTTTLPIATVTTGASTSHSSISTTTSTSTRLSAASVSSQTVQTVTTTLVSTPPASTGVTTVTQIIVVSPTTSATLTSPIIPLTTSSTSTSAQGALTCTQGYHSCPVSLGGGCCPTARICASNSLCVESSTSSSTSSLTTTASAVPPVRPTSGSNSESSTTSSVVVSGCPTGFYMCSAYYLGGCCRVGRNCDSTSCPAGDSTSVVVTTGLTIVAGGSGASSVDVITYTSTTTPGSSGGTGASTTAQGSCANAWYSCGSNEGGGCCPSGFVCGASCTATVSGQSNVGKESPSFGARGLVLAWGVLALGVVSAVGMIVL